MERYVKYILEQVEELLKIDSPSGFTGKVSDYLMKELQSMGYHPELTVKGGVIVSLGGKENALLFAAHVDTLGAVTAEIKENGRLRISPVGGLNANNVEAENCRIYTKEDQCYEGTCQLENAAIHVNTKYDEIRRSFDTVEIVLDEPVKTKEDVRALGIENGDYVCFDPKTRITPSGYIKSRFLDDKLSAAILLGFAKYVKEENIELSRKIYLYNTVYEEVGHGASSSIPPDVKETISVDMGCVGTGLACTEREVSICAKDSGGPYDSEIVRRLVKTAKKADISYAVDVYPAYGSDVEASLRAGYDMRHGLIGPGVYASHGYERSHVDGVKNTFRLITEYIKQ
ncbi:MAG: M42 family metallopeptidase [Lachnospiraceae bacterium]|nr:M42 family metallopeptidase [Lachnospiraceae bacterium]